VLLDNEEWIMMKAWMIGLLLVVFGIGIANGNQVEDAKARDIKKLIEVTGAMEIGKQLADALSTQMAQHNNQLTKEEFSIVKTVMLDAFEEHQDSLVQKVVAVYSRYFTAEEIKGMIQFYETDLGKKTIKVMPALMQESIFAGQEWGQEIMPSVMDKVKAELDKKNINIAI